jgi:hypothetical protein
MSEVARRPFRESWSAIKLDLSRNVEIDKN